MLFRSRVGEGGEEGAAVLGGDELELDGGLLPGGLGLSRLMGGGGDPGGGQEDGPLHPQPQDLALVLGGVLLVQGLQGLQDVYKRQPMGIACQGARTDKIPPPAQPAEGCCILGKIRPEQWSQSRRSAFQSKIRPVRGSISKDVYKRQDCTLFYTLEQGSINAVSCFRKQRKMDRNIVTALNQFFI